MKSGRNWGRLGMTFNIKQVQLKDLLLEPIRNGLTKPKAIRGRGVPMIAMGEIFANNRIFSFPMERVPVTDKELSSSSIYEGDLLFARQSLVLEGAGKCCIVKEVNEPTVFESHLIRVRLDNSKALPDYIYYYFNSYQGKENIKTIVEQVAAAGIRGRDLVNLYIPIPPITVQQQILQVLMSIDDKIAINTTINENLEQQAQAIFSNLFPKCMSNGIAMSNIIDVRDGTHDSPKAKKEGYSLITSKHLQAYSVNKKEANLISYEDFNKINERSKVEYGDILISMIGTVGIISFISDKSIDFAIKNVGLFRTSQSAKLRFYVLNYLKTNEVANYIEQHLAGSTQKYISLTELRNLPIRIPSDEDLQEYNELISPIYGQIITLSKENQWLTELRDTLLPKLMNGEIDVSEVKI